MSSKLISPPKTFYRSDSAFRRKHQNSLDVLQHKNSQVSEYIDQINPKTIIAIEFEEQRLNQRYFHLLNQLERTRQQISKLEEKMKLQNDLEGHPEVRQILDELNNIDKYKLALIGMVSKFSSDLTDNKQSIAELKLQIHQKRLEVRQVVHEAWAAQAAILQAQNQNRKSQAEMLQFKSLEQDQQPFLTQSVSIPQLQIPQIPYKASTKYLPKIIQSAQNTNQSNTVQEIISIYTAVNQINAAVAKSKQQMNQISNRFSQIRNLFADCVNLSVKQFKSKQKITNSNGYANSIFFDVSQQANKSIIGESFNKERNIKNILYDTLQHIMIDMIDSQQKNDSNGSTIADSIIKHQVTLEQFMLFTPEQILGLIVLQPRLLNEIMTVFDLKQKQIGLLQQKLKTTNNISQR